MLQAHIWDTSKRKQVYIGTYAEEVQAAKAHDVVALKWRGRHATVNCNVAVYSDLLPLLDTVTLVSISGTAVSLLRLLVGGCREVLCTV